MSGTERSRWERLARESVVRAHDLARARYGKLEVSIDDLLRATVLRTLARFQRAGREADELAFRSAVERAALDDLVLALAWERGDELAWQLYASQFSEGLAAAARAQGASRERAEEWADELPGLLLAPRAEGASSPLARYDGSGSLRSWLVTIVRRNVIDDANRGQREEPLEPTLTDSQQRGPRESAEQREAAELARRAGALLRDELTPRERLVLLLKHEQGLSQRDIATQIGVSDSRVTRLVQHAMEKVRSRIGNDLGALLLEDGTIPAALVSALDSAQTERQITGPGSDPCVGPGGPE